MCRGERVAEPRIRLGPDVIDLEELQAICTRLPERDARRYLPYLREAMLEAEITTPSRVAAFLAQLAHESGEFRFWTELSRGDAYEGRKDLGNLHPGDGPRYKGRGPIQLTGRANYRAAGEALGLPLEKHPELAALPEHGFRIAAWYWTTRNLNTLADAGDFRTLTRRINGGLNGYAERLDYWNRARRILCVEEEVA